MKINPNARVRVETVLGEVPVLFVEDFYEDPDAVRAQALGVDYDITAAMYPGRHALVATPESAAVVRSLCELLTSLGDQIYDPADCTADFSIVVTKEKDLLAGQKHPHIDPTPVLGIVYLNPVNGAGTSFYYNKVLRTAVVRDQQDRDGLAEFHRALALEHEPKGYSLEDHPCWERVYTIEGKYNRLVVYPGNVFHAVDIRSIPAEFSMNTVRLTQRFIPLRCTPKPPGPGR